MSVASYRLPDVSMVELPPIETKFEKNELGAQLHATLLADMRNKNYDPFAARNNVNLDKAYLNSQKLVEADRIVRANLHGPSIQREKFSSTYWRTWNTEKNLLEDISYDEVIKQNVESYLSSTTRKSSIQQRANDAKQLSTSLRVRRRKLRSATKCRAVAFDAPGAYEARSMYVGSENKGDNSVSFLLKSCLKRDTPVNHRDKNATVDPEDIGAKPKPGGAMSLANRLNSKTSTAITAKCDYPPLETPVNPNKGSLFGTQPRFNAEFPKPLTISGSGDEATLSTIERPTSKPGIVFGRADRFAGSDERGSVILKIPLKTESSVVSAITGEDQETADGNSMGRKVAPSDNEANARPRSAAKLLLARPRSASGKAGGSIDSEEAAKSTVGDFGSNISVSNPPSAEKQYVEYEYFPNDRPGPGHYDVRKPIDLLRSRNMIGNFLCVGF